MQTVKARLSAKYIYIRCDSDFVLNFTNGSILPFHRGFYALLSSDLQKYNTNNEFDIITQDDSASIWWLSSDTLIMSVTDINTDYLELITSYHSLENNYNLLSSDLLAQNRDLLMSLQNSLSTFLNAYVEANSIVDYGYQQGSITGGVAKIYIAKPSSVNKYNFNATVIYNGSISPVSWELGWHNSFLGDIDHIVTNSLLFEFSDSPKSLSYLNVVAKSLSIPFTLYDNSNSILSGYSVSNVSYSSSINFSGCIRRNVTNNGTFYKPSVNFNSSSLLTSCSYSSANFVLGGTSVELAVGSDNVSYVPISGIETLSITFDVAKS